MCDPVSEIGKESRFRGRSLKRLLNFHNYKLEDMVSTSMGLRIILRARRKNSLQRKRFPANKCIDQDKCCYYAILSYADVDKALQIEIEIQSVFFDRSNEIREFSRATSSACSRVGNRQLHA